MQVHAIVVYRGPHKETGLPACHVQYDNWDPEAWTAEHMLDFFNGVDPDEKPVFCRLDPSDSVLMIL